MNAKWTLVSRDARPEGTRVRIGDITIGGGEIVVAAGPCAVESEAQIFTAAEEVARAGARLLRGGAFKPRTSPYSFQGLGEEGLRLLTEAGRACGLPVVTEVLAVEDVALVARHADLLQIGARNMQNTPLLRAVGAAGRPVLLKRGLASTIDELLYAAEHIAVHGNAEVILCERGIRTFETATRNTLDLNAVALLRRLTHLPVIVDPSHGTGRRELVAPLALAAVAAGADGLIVEMHPNPDAALSDGAQSLDPESFALMMDGMARLAPAIGRSLTPPAGEALAEYRRRIDALDEAIVALLSGRMETALRLNSRKRAAGCPVHAPEREAEVLAHVSHLANEALSREAVARLFRAIIAETREVQA